MSKKVYLDNAREEFLLGVELVYTPVVSTMGPMGKNAFIGRPYQSPLVSNDGVTVARSISSSNPALNASIEMMKEVSSLMEKEVGDGTTTVISLTRNLLKESHKLLQADYQPTHLKQQLQADSKQALSILDTLKQPTTTEQELIDVATISSKDPDIGTIIGSLTHQVGIDGVIKVEEGHHTIEPELIKGLVLDSGVISNYMITDSKTMSTTFTNPKILLSNGPITKLKELQPILTKLENKGINELFIICDGISEDILNLIERAKGIFKIAVIKCPSMGTIQKELMEDIASLVGAELVSNFKSVAIKKLGQAKKIVVTKEETTIFEGKGDPTERLNMLKYEESKALSDHDKQALSTRIASLTGKLGIIKVGSPTESEKERLKQLVDDAVSATRAAQQEGIVPGGGITLVNLAGLINTSTEGSKILQKALQMPFKTILENADIDPGYWLAQLEGTSGEGLNVKDHKGLIPLMDNGIIDPVKVTRLAIEYAVAYASNFIDMGSLIVDEE